MIGDGPAGPMLEQIGPVNGLASTNSARLEHEVGSGLSAAETPASGLTRVRESKTVDSVRIGRGFVSDTEDLARWKTQREPRGHRSARGRGAHHARAGHAFEQIQLILLFIQQVLFLN